jgi:hypothetical protein
LAHIAEFEPTSFERIVKSVKGGAVKTATPKATVEKTAATK